MVEFLGYRFAFNTEDFEQRVTAAAVKLGLVEDNDLDEDETEDLVELAADGLIEEPRSSLGRYLVRHWEQLSLIRGESLVYWLRKLVFRGAWLDHRVKEGLLEVDWDDEEARVRVPRPARRPRPSRARAGAVLARSPVPPVAKRHLNEPRPFRPCPGVRPRSKGVAIVQRDTRKDAPQRVEVPTGWPPPSLEGLTPLRRRFTRISVLPSGEEQLLSQAADDTAAAMLTEARGLLLRGWSKCAQARDVRGHVVNAWSDEAASWSLVGALLASWHRHDDRLDADFVAHSVEARALADATTPSAARPARSRSTPGTTRRNGIAATSSPPSTARWRCSTTRRPKRSRRALLPASQRPRARARASSRSARAACAG